MPDSNANQSFSEQDKPGVFGHCDMCDTRMTGEPLVSKGGKLCSTECLEEWNMVSPYDDKKGWDGVWSGLEGQLFNQARRRLMKKRLGEKSALLQEKIGAKLDTRLQQIRHSNPDDSTIHQILVRCQKNELEPVQNTVIALKGEIVHAWKDTDILAVDVNWAAVMALAAMEKVVSLESERGLPLSSLPQTGLTNQ